MFRSPITYHLSPIADRPSPRNILVCLPVKSSASRTEDGGKGALICQPKIFAVKRGRC
jgi:hypothetical protein